MGILVCFLLFEIQKMVLKSERPLLGGQFSDIFNLRLILGFWILRGHFLV